MQDRDKAAVYRIASLPPDPRNLVVLCDGTGNEVTGDFSNVLKLYRIAVHDAGQRVYYHPGVGTIAVQSDWHRALAKLRAVWGLATGAGLDDDILRAYAWLAETWREGDRVFLFGFSRGAYTARALAGMIHMIGLLPPDAIGNAPYALIAYKRAGWDKQHGRPAPHCPSVAEQRRQLLGADDDAARIKRGQDNLGAAFDVGRALASRPVRIDFLGAWDTVASMIAPKPGSPFPTLLTLPFTRRNPSVLAFRHAMAIDERRRMFRPFRWCPDQVLHDGTMQDCKQVWFPGVHSDIGGGYAEAESGLAKCALKWMVDEAAMAGLRIDSDRYRRMVCGESLSGKDRSYYSKPDPAAKLHNSLTAWWWPLELILKSTSFRDWPRWSLLGLYLPLAEPRPIDQHAVLHPAVAARLAARPDYDPVNLKRRPPPARPPSPATNLVRKIALFVLFIVLAVLGLGLLKCLALLIGHGLADIAKAHDGPIGTSMAWARHAVGWLPSFRCCRPGA